MTRLQIRLATASVTGIFLAGARPAMAHHVMDGKLPQTVGEGLLSGLAHPIIGADHFAFIVGVGLISQIARRLALLPMLFLLGTVVGCFLHLQGVNLPWSEAGVAISVGAAAAIVAMYRQIPTGILAILFAASGVVHGYAYGESIVGAETSSLLAYVIGFVAIQYGLAVGVGAAFGLIVERGHVSQPLIMRIAGGGIALGAVVSFASIIMAA